MTWQLGVLTPGMVIIFTSLPIEQWMKTTLSFCTIWVIWYQLLWRNSRMVSVFYCKICYVWKILLLLNSVLVVRLPNIWNVLLLFILIAFDEGERILILPWAQAASACLAASTSCTTVSDMVTKLCFSCAMMYNFALVSMSWTLPTSNSVSYSTLNCVQQTTKSVNRSRQHHH